MGYERDAGDEAHRIVRAITQGLHGQRLTRLLLMELETRLQAILEGDGTAGLGPSGCIVDADMTPEPDVGPAALVAQAIAAATAGRARPKTRDLRWRETGPSSAEISYSGCGCPDWADITKSLGRGFLAGRVAELVDCGTDRYGCDAWFGRNGRRDDTLVIGFR